MFYFGGLLAPQITHVIQMSVVREKGGWDFAIFLYVPQDSPGNMGPPGQIPTAR